MSRLFAVVSSSAFLSAVLLAALVVNRAPLSPALHGTTTWTTPLVRSSALKYYQVRVFNPSSSDILAFSELGGEVTPNRDLTECLVIFNEAQMTLFRRDFAPHFAHIVESDDLAASTESIMIEEVAKHQLSKNQPGIPTVRQAYGDRATISEDWITAGSMGGYRTHAELEALIVEFGETYSDIITRGPESIGTTVRGNSIHVICMGTSGKPRSLLMGMHHAREGMSVVVPIYVLKHIGDNYLTDEELGYFMREHEVCFVPQLNPDGYLINEGTNPNGGGLHRKNDNLQTRCEATPTNRGVDLNRNYDYNHGTVGASDDCTQNDYHGNTAFSELESQAIRDFVDAQGFKTIYSYHGFGAFLIHPDSSSATVNAVPAGDLGQALLSYGQALTSKNGYLLGNAQGTVNYRAAGGSDDYFSIVKGIIAYTPEVGDYPLTGDGRAGFWPTIGDMQGICEENLFDAQEITFMAGPFYTPQVLDVTASGDDLTVSFAIKNIGQSDSDGAVTVTIEPATGASEPGSSVDLGGLAARATAPTETITVKGGAGAAFNLVAKDSSDFPFTTSVKWDGTAATTAICYHGEATGEDTCTCSDGWTGDRCQICPGREACVTAPTNPGGGSSMSPWIWVSLAAGVLLLLAGIVLVAMYTRQVQQYRTSVMAEDEAWAAEKSPVNFDQKSSYTRGASKGSKGSGRSGRSGRSGSRSATSRVNAKSKSSRSRASTGGGARRGSKSSKRSKGHKASMGSKGSKGSKVTRMTQATSRTRK